MNKVYEVDLRVLEDILAFAGLFCYNLSFTATSLIKVKVCDIINYLISVRINQAIQVGVKR